MRVRSLAASSCLTAAWLSPLPRAAATSSSSGGSSTSGSSGSKSLTIYSSLPLQGDSRPQSESVVNGEKLALEEAGGKAGKYTINYVALDDATAAAGKWDPGQVSANARKAAQDKRRSPTSASSTRARRRSRCRSSTRPASCRSRPSNTYVGLTRPRAPTRASRDKYYPSGKRTYGRVVPADHIQAAAQVDLP